MRTPIVRLLRGRIRQHAVYVRPQPGSDRSCQKRHQRKLNRGAVDSRSLRARPTGPGHMSTPDPWPEPPGAPRLAIVSGPRRRAHDRSASGAAPAIVYGIDTSGSIGSLQTAAPVRTRRPHADDVEPASYPGPRRPSPRAAHAPMKSPPASGGRTSFTTATFRA